MRVDGRDPVGEGGRTERATNARDIGQIFDRDRDAEQWRQVVGVGVAQRPFGLSGLLAREVPVTVT